MRTTGVFRTKWWLWFVITSGLICAAGYIPIVKSEEEWFSYWGCWGVVLRGGAFMGTVADTGMILIFQGILWGIALAAVGWILHRILLAALPRPAAPQSVDRGLLAPRGSVRQRLIVATIVVMALFAPCGLCGLAWLHTPPPPKVEFEYPDRVTFRYSGKVVWWSASDVHAPEPCPLMVHFDGIDLDRAALESPERLRGFGWDVFVNHREQDGRVYSLTARSPGRAVECSYIHGRLWLVEVGTIRGTGQPPPETVAVSFAGRRVALPSSREVIIAVLGPPLQER
jgi:hypothetical protein